MCGYFCTGFIDFVLKVRSLLDYVNLLSYKKYQSNDKTILKYFRCLQTKMDWGLRILTSV